jgi:hypothetical protein
MRVVLSFSMQSDLSQLVAVLGGVHCSTMEMWEEGTGVGESSGNVGGAYEYPHLETGCSIGNAAREGPFGGFAGEWGT